MAMAILTANARSVLNQAFQRRVQTMVAFPYPDRAAREAVWQKTGRFSAGPPLWPRPVPRVCAAQKLMW